MQRLYMYLYSTVHMCPTHSAVIWHKCHLYIVPSWLHLVPVLWSRNFLFRLRLRLSKSFGFGSRSGSDDSFVTAFYHRFHIKKWIFHVFMKEYQPNSHFLILYNMNSDFYLLLRLTRSRSWEPEPEHGSRSREPEPKLRYAGSSSGSGSTTLIST